MTNAESTARDMIRQMNAEMLLAQWELTSISNDPYIYTVRGWLMDEIEKRWPDEFDRWLDSEADDFDLRKYIV